jgi:hypothetical protein
VIRRVEVALAVLKSAHEQFGEERSLRGDGSEDDFVGGPLADARDNLLVERSAQIMWISTIVWGLRPPVPLARPWSTSLA